MKVSISQKLGKLVPVCRKQSFPLLLATSSTEVHLWCLSAYTKAYAVFQDPSFPTQIHLLYITKPPTSPLQLTSFLLPQIATIFIRDPTPPSLLSALLERQPWKPGINFFPWSDCFSFFTVLLPYNIHIFFS